MRRWPARQPTRIVLALLALAASTLPADPAHAGGPPTPGLEDTEWKLTRLGDRAVAVTTPAAQPYLVLKSTGEEVSGFGGCNRFMGKYRVEGETLDLGRIAVTMMACAEAMDREADFFRALQATRRWKIVDRQLELYDEDGKMLARFEARD